MIRCEWCTCLGLLSIHPGLVNGATLIQICTDCSNRMIPDSVRGHYGIAVPIEETGIERRDREVRLAAVI